MTIKIISLFLIVGCVLLIVVGIWKIHTLPGVIAKKRHHPQAEAIEITAYLGLIAFPLWMAALIWAYLKPVIRPIVVEQNQNGPQSPPTPASADETNSEG